MKIETIQIPDSIMKEVYGVETMDEVRAIQNEEQKLWCSCEDSKDSYYVPDNKHPEVDKHHWRCTSCDKITQIG